MTVLSHLASRTMASRISHLLLAAAPIALLPALAGGQVVRGAIRDANTGAALGGTVVSIVAGTGARAMAGFSDVAGTYALRITQPGAYRVRVERIGYEPHTSSSFGIAAGETVIRDVALTPKPQIVATVSVAGERLCAVDAADGMRAVSVWDDLRAALEATVITALERRLRVRFLRYERALDLRLRETRREAREVSRLGGMAFVSVPAADLARDGYVVGSGTDDIVYRALDAEVILAPSFLDLHCFSPAPPHSSNDSLVGLAFEPIRRRREIVDVRGILWLNRFTHQLIAIDFGYDGLRLRVNTDQIGGRIEFARLETGRWIVSRWWIRMPRIERRQSFSGNTPTGFTEVLIGYHEAGGEVLGVERMTMALTAPTRGAGRDPRVTGTIHDSSSGGPLAGAVVTVSGTAITERTSERGTFTLDRLPRGDLMLEATHPRLDSLGIPKWSWPLAADTAITRTVALALPSLEDLLARVCPGGRPARDRGVVIGRVRAYGTASALQGATVRVTWLVTSIGASGVQSMTRFAGAETAPDGSFVICGVPVESALRAEVRRQGYAPAGADVRLDADRRWWRLDFDLRSGESIVLPPAGAAREQVLRGSVRDPDGQPIAYAHLRVGAHDGRVTDDSGRFQVSVGDRGRIVIEARRVGFARASITLDGVPDTLITVEMQPLPASLETVRIEAQTIVRALEVGGFYRRMGDRAKGAGSGIFITPEEIETRVVQRATQLVDGVPGVRLVAFGGFPPQWALAGNTRCIMTVYLNRARLNTLGPNAPPPALDDVVSPMNVAGIEVYSRSNAPPDYQALAGTCGVVLVWSK